MRGILGFVLIPGNVAVFKQQVPLLHIYIRICPFTADKQVWDSFSLSPKPASAAATSVTGLQVPQVWEHLSSCN